MMKRNYLYMAIGFVLVGMTACMDDTPYIKQTDKEARRIYLSAGIRETVSSRTPYYPTDGNGNVLSVPTMSHPLDVSVWASTDDTKFSHKTDKDGNVYDGSIGNEVAIHTTAHFQSAAPQLLGEAIYPTPPENGTIVVNFIGLHPQSQNGGMSWQASNENQDASYTFTGKEDVMFAPKIYGEYGLDYEKFPDKIPTFHFHHLLTWLRIKMVANWAETNILEKEKVSKAWGKIKSLTLLEQQNTITINNVGEVTKETLSSHVEFSGTPAGMSLYQLGTDDRIFPATENYMIPTTETEVAYVMCAPVDGIYQHTVEGEDVLKPEYILHIETEGRGELDIPIDLKVNDGDVKASYFTGSTMGKQFTILLNFKMGNVVSVSTDILVGGDTDWFTHGTGSGDLTENELQILVN